MNIHILIPRRTHRPRKNPLWLIHWARKISALRGKFAEYRRLRRTGLQDNSRKSAELRVRAVRREPI